MRIKVETKDSVIEIPTLSTRAKVYWSAQQARVQIAEQAGDYIGSLFVCCLFDAVYYLPPLKDVKRIMEQRKTDELMFVDEISDCDDFNRKLVIAFLDDAYRTIDGERVRRPPYLFGEAYSYDHAFNFCFTDDGRMRLIEPQTSEIFLVSDFDAGIVELRA